MATGANTTPLGRLHPVLAAKMAQEEDPPPPPPPPSDETFSASMGTLIPATAMGGILPTPHCAPIPIYQPPPPNPVAIGASKAASVAASLTAAASAGGSKDPELKRHLEAAKRAASALFPEEPARKKRKSRWGSELVRITIPGLPTVLPANMSEDQQKLYLLHLKIEEISRQLRTGDLGIPLNPADRSPSPEPIYSHDGKRLNVREVRVRKRLEDQRHEFIQEAVKLNPLYKPPADYKAPNRKFEDKVFIPQEDHPETNFVGLLIGPRGNTLKQLERETNTKIMIRGKGATKEGKFGRFGLPQPGEDEELHALITGTSPEVVKNAVDKIKGIIQSGIDVPGNDNEIKKMQLMQLAELNGTFKPVDLLRCNNCGSSAHRTWQCTESMNIVSSVICSRCGGGGHIAQDCKTDLSAAPPPSADKAKMDSEYLSLMKELGEKIPEHMQDKSGVAMGTRVPPPPGLALGTTPGGGLLVPDPHFHPAPAQPGNPWVFHPAPGPFMVPGGPHPGGPLLVTPGGIPPVPWGIPPGAVGPDGVPIMGGPIGPPPPPPPGTGDPGPNAAAQQWPPQPQDSGQWVPPPPPAALPTMAPPPPPPDHTHEAPGAPPLPPLPPPEPEV